jgi:hypothetical protein
MKGTSRVYLRCVQVYIAAHDNADDNDGDSPQYSSSASLPGRPGLSHVANAIPGPEAGRSSSPKAKLLDGRGRIEGRSSVAAKEA